MTLSPKTVGFLRQHGWDRYDTAWPAFAQNPYGFAFELLQYNVATCDIQTLLTYCFSSMYDGMSLSVAWNEDGAERWYPCTLRTLPAGAAGGETTSSGSWFGIEGPVRKHSGPWQVTSHTFATGDGDYVLFDPFEDTWKVESCA